MTADDLDLFAASYGLDAEELRNRGSIFKPYRIIRDLHRPFDGKITTLLVDKSAYRFGNRVYQAINASLIARRLSVTTIGYDAATDFMTLPQSHLGVQFVPPHQAQSRPVLYGEFFHYLGFESLLEPLDAAFILETVDQMVSPLFRPPGRQALPASVIALHFRSGDIFANVGTDGWIPGLYVMPPASFYITAVEYARSHFGVTDVRIVYEDRQNPAIQAVEDYCTRTNIPFVSQSSHLIEDWSTLLASKYLAVPFGTFAEAAALLSADLRALFSFRHVESHEFFYNRPRSLVATLLAGGRNVKLLLCNDAAGGYIPERGWIGTPEQMELIRSYPSSSLTMSEVR